jgi:drug/metabolite transporter (DMT)-like permease
VGSRRSGLPLLLLGAGLLGFSAIFVKWSAPASPVVIGFYRMLFALPVVGSLMVAGTSGDHPRMDWRGVPWAVLAGLCFAGDLSLWHTALRWTSAASATLLVGLSPLWVSLVMVLFLGARLRKRAWLGLSLALAGALILALAKGARLAGNFGELLGGLASLCYAGYTLALGRARRHLGANQTLFWVVLTCLCFFGLTGLLRGDSFGAGFPGRVWWSLLGLGLLVQVTGWWLIAKGFGSVPTNVGSVGLLMQQVATVVLGWVLLQEGLAPAQALGTALILLGIALSSTSPPQIKPEPSVPGST